MKKRVKDIFRSWRVWVLMIAILLAVIAINPSVNVTGVAIRGIERDSPASLAGIEIPEGVASPRAREIIRSINNAPINNIDDYLKEVSGIEPNMTVLIRTNKGDYQLIAGERNNQAYLGLNVYDAPENNIRFGLEIVGGTRAILQPTGEYNESDIDFVLQSLKERLNVYGLSDVVVRLSRDLEGRSFIVVEIAGATSEEIVQLLSQQGLFEAKIGDEVVFIGGERDVTYVCRTPQCSWVVDPRRGIQRVEGGFMANFGFSITLSPQAAQRFADITRDLKVVYEGQDSYLNESIDLYLDGNLIDSLRISSGLKGRAETSIQISGPGFGATQREAILDSEQNMKQLQTVLMTGSLPVQLDIVKIDTLSPKLGEEFISNAVFVGLLAGLAVMGIIYIRYRKKAVVLPVGIVLLSEVLILLGFAAVVGWNLDLASIAGIIIAVGTGVDDQIIILDEIKRGTKSTRFINWKEMIQRAFFIIMGAYFTTLAAMIPLFWAGVGMLRGFAFTTIVGVSVGVFITRPAFAKIAEILLKEY
ncbi:MAG TPA: hypothetical protein ENN46_03240 [Candidatus Woesearchaeota archaeon]|nr:hypothetical protein [Candidatus Woesearchaeota archaeon]